MDFLTNKAKQAYLPKRKNLVEEMQKQGGWWKNIGDRFEEFKPSSKSKVPTEWWISASLISRIFTKKFWWQKRNKEVCGVGEVGSDSSSADVGLDSLV
jgi:hypothetical protein